MVYTVISLVGGFFAIYCICFTLVSLFQAVVGYWKDEEKRMEKRHDRLDSYVDKKKKAEKLELVMGKIKELNYQEQIEKLEERLQSICKHEQGFNYKFDNIHGYVSKVRVCRSCGVLQSYLTFDDFDADRKAQEIKECEEKLKKLKGDKKCTK
jgi:DNA repair ATPase RecN